MLSAQISSSETAKQAHKNKSGNLTPFLFLLVWDSLQLNQFLSVRGKSKIAKVRDVMEKNEEKLIPYLKNTSFPEFMVNF